MTTPPPMPWHHQVSRLALFISVPQAIASPIMVGLSHLLRPNNVFFEVEEILDFLAISFPLTLSIAILFVIIEKGEFNLGWLLVVVVGAAFLSNLLHSVIEKMPSIDIKKTYDETVNDGTNTVGSASAIKFVFKIFGVYWKKFGAILFIQSCCIGIYAGYKYVKMEESKKVKK